MPKKDRPTRAGAERILIVEDEYFLADDCAQQIARFGMKVIGPFGNADGALKALVNEKPDGAIIDVIYMAPLLFRFAKALRERGVPFVFYTGYPTLPAHFPQAITVKKTETPEAAVRALLRCMKKAGPEIRMKRDVQN